MAGALHKTRSNIFFRVLLDSHFCSEVCCSQTKYNNIPAKRVFIIQPKKIGNDNSPSITNKTKPIRKRASDEKVNFSRTNPNRDDFRFQFLFFPHHFCPELTNKKNNFWGFVEERDCHNNNGKVRRRRKNMASVRSKQAANPCGLWWVVFSTCLERTFLFFLKSPNVCGRTLHTYLKTTDKQKSGLWKYFHPCVELIPVSEW